MMAGADELKKNLEDSLDPFRREGFACALHGPL
jgi:hypothetical protein